ncbi:hypothetical protein D3C80_436560 [compost metagenome]
MLLAIPRGERPNFRHIPDHGFNVLFDEQLGIAIGRLPDQTVALLVLEQVGGDAKQHLGVPHPRRLDEVDLADIVVGHRVDDGHLKRQRLPAALLIGGLNRQIVMLIHPLSGSLNRRAEQGRQTKCDGSRQATYLCCRYIHPVTPAADHPGRPPRCWL